ncbi:MAG TPA: PrsW family glutamic-type intramembrane protease, partial [Solirubrobacteraceae bacterium]|nr:PrsW family glutamic-type intramembrane protease [Solirubrobacteraceae bacterium]
PALRTRRAGPRRSLVAVAVVLLILAGLLTLLLIGVEVGPVALATGLVLAVLPVPIYVALALFVDRFEPEPPRLLAWAFFWGATGATLIALVVNTVGQAVVGGAFGSAVGELYGASLSAPIVEEGAKAVVLFAIYRWRRAEFDGVLDGIVYAAMVGLGFAFCENVLYYGRTALEGGVPLAATFFVRGVLAPFAHPLFTGLTGLGLGLVALRTGTSRRVAPILGLLGAMVLHSLWNTSAGVGGGPGFLAVYVLVMIPVFFALVGVAIGALLREGRVLREYLGLELAGGFLTREDVAVLSSLRARRRALREARSQGPEALRARKELHHAATELAFLRRHAAKRPDDDRERLTHHEAAYAARLRALRSGLALGVPAGIAYTSGPEPAQGDPLATLPTPGAGAQGTGRAGGMAAPDSASAPAAPAAWYADPYRQARLRWWDGWRWTEHVAP